VGNKLVENMLPKAEWASRIGRLIVERGMTYRAARIVVDAAMYNIGCTEGTVRKRIEEEQREANAG
jgi:hypothetical protein